MIMMMLMLMILCVKTQKRKEKNNFYCMADVSAHNQGITVLPLNAVDERSSSLLYLFQREPYKRLLLMRGRWHSVAATERVCKKSRFGRKNIL